MKIAINKIYVVGLVLLALLAYAAVTAAGASASEETWEWLVNGSAITGESLVPAEMQGELELEDMKATGGEVEVKCSFYWHLWLYPGGLDETLTLLTLAGVEVTEAKPLSCSFVRKGACSGTEATVVPLNLFWHTQVIHYISPGFVLFIIDFILPFPGKSNPGYLIECNTVLGKVDDSCIGETGAKLENLTGGVEATFIGGGNAEEEVVTKPITCSLGGEKAGLLKGKFMLTSPEGTVSASE